jgi:hypothetical protein
MSLGSFLTSLFNDGHVKLASPELPTADELRATDTLLREYERVYRLEFPGEPPPYASAAARWAAAMLYRACQFIVYRELPGEWIGRDLAAPCPKTAPASDHYSVDLVFRFLPDVVRLARSAAEGDPLVQQLGRWASEWPLSSVGIAGVVPADLSAILSHQGLLDCYVDRIMEKVDLSRLSDRHVRQAARRHLGTFGELAPQIAAHLEAAEAGETGSAPPQE